MSKAPPPPYPPPTEVPTLGYPSPPPAKPKPTSQTTRCDQVSYLGAMAPYRLRRIVLSAKEKWLIDAGARLLTGSHRLAWEQWAKEQEPRLAAGDVSQPLPTSIAEVALMALSTLRRALESALESDRAGEKEDELVNDLEAVALVMADEIQTTLLGWCCPHCGKPVGYLGRLWAWLVGVGIHGCDFSVYKRRHGL